MSKNMLIVSALFLLGFVIFSRLGSFVFMSNSDMIVDGLIAGQDVGLLIKEAFLTSAVNPMNWTWSNSLSTINQWLHEFIDVIFPAIIVSIDTTVIPFLSAVIIESRAAAMMPSTNGSFKLWKF